MWSRTRSPTRLGVAGLHGHRDHGVRRVRRLFNCKQVVPPPPPAITRMPMSLNHGRTCAWCSCTSADAVRIATFTSSRRTELVEQDTLLHAAPLRSRPCFRIPPPPDYRAVLFARTFAGRTPSVCRRNWFVIVCVPDRRGHINHDAPDHRFYFVCATDARPVPDEIVGLSAVAPNQRGFRAAPTRYTTINERLAAAELRTSRTIHVRSPRWRRSFQPDGRVAQPPRYCERFTKIADDGSRRRRRVVQNSQGGDAGRSETSRRDPRRARDVAFPGGVERSPPRTRWARGVACSMVEGGGAWAIEMPAYRFWQVGVSPTVSYSPIPTIAATSFVRKA